MAAAFLPRTAFQQDTRHVSQSVGDICCYLYPFRCSIFARFVAADIHLGWQLVDDNRLPQRSLASF
jgi:hypothetical protein